jgi:hypothetical protein
MTAVLVATDDAVWRFSPEDPPPLADRIQAVLRLNVHDEITGGPPDVGMRVMSSSPGLAPRATRGGLVGLIGRPLALWQPGFVAGAPLAMTVTADGFLPLDVAATLGPQPGYPASFAPVDLPDADLHRQPAAISARTVAKDRTVLSGTTVQVTGVWQAQADLTNPAAPANLVAIACGLYADRPLGGSVARIDITLAPLAQAKTLLAAVSAGALQLRASDQSGLAAGSLVAIDPLDPGRAEVIPVTAITDAGSGPDLPATLVLAHALRRDHAQGAMVVLTTPGPPGAANPLARAARAGDVTLFTATMTGLDATLAAVEVSGGGAPAEYHGISAGLPPPPSPYRAASIYQAISDADGYLRLPPIHRVAQVQLTADHPAQPQLVQPVPLDWGRDEIILDLVFQ